MARQQATFSTSLGWMAVIWTGSLVARLTFGYGSAKSAHRAAGRATRLDESLSTAQKSLVRRLQEFAEGTPQDFSDIGVDVESYTSFQRRVLNQCRRIPWGSTVTYAELARRSGSRGAARAVGNVMAQNPIPLIVPCHRVVGAQNRLGGFSAPSGTTMKKRLLEREAVSLE